MKKDGKTLENITGAVMDHDMDAVLKIDDDPNDDKGEFQVSLNVNSTFY